MTHPTQLSVQHGFAYKESGQFAGWPANCGILNTPKFQRNPTLQLTYMGEYEKHF